MSSPLGPTGFAALVCTGVFGACLGTSGAAGEDGGRVDVAILTFSRTALRAVVERLDEGSPVANESAPPETGEWTRGRVLPPRRGTPYRLAVGLAPHPGRAAAESVARTALRRWQPRYILLIGTAVGLADAPASGSVALCRMIWRYDMEGQRVIPRRERSFRAEGALVAAALSIEPGWRERLRGDGSVDAESARLVTGACASGDASDDSRSVRQQLLRANPRTIVAEREGDGAAAAVQEARDRGTPVGFAMIRTVTERPGPPSSARGGDAMTPEVLAAAFAVHLIRFGWPVPPRPER